MSVEALLTRSEVLSCSFALEGKPCLRFGSLKCGRSSIVCSRIHKKRCPGLPITRRKFAHFNRSPNELSRWVTLPRGLCRAQTMDFPPGMPFSSPVEVLHACRILRLELLFKPVVHIVRCLDFRESIFLSPPSHCLLVSRPLLCNLVSPNCRLTFIARVLGRVLLAVMLFVCIALQPVERFAAPAFAASSTADATNRDSRDFYEILFKKFEEKDEEMSRSEKLGGFQQRLRELHMKVKEKKQRAEAAKRALEELHKSESGEQFLSPQEKRVWTLLERTFQDFKEKLKEKLEAVSYAFPFEEELRSFFNKKIAELLTSKNKALGSGDEAALKQKVRGFIGEIRVEERKLQVKALREREEACKQLKVEELQLKDILARLINKHFTLQEQSQVSDGDKEESEEQIQALESEIQGVWERLLDVKATLWQREIGNLQEALVKLPSLEMQLEEGFWSALKDKTAASSAEETQQKEAQEKVVNDLTKVLNSVFEHKFLPEAVDIEPFETKVDDEILAYLDTLKAEEKPAKELLDTINKVIREDIEAEKMNTARTPRQGNVVVAPGLQRLKEEKRAELKQFLSKNPEVAREFAAQKQERVLTVRDRILAQTWYNEKGKRWEMSSEGLNYAVDKGLVDSARVRHDKCVMLFQLKGDTRTFFADLLAYDAAYFNYGGFKTLHTKMLGSGIPAPVVFMPIPWSQLDPMRVFFFPFRIILCKIGNLLKAFIQNPLATSFFQFTIHTIEELLGRVVFPLLEKLPNLIQNSIGLHLPENAPPRNKVPFLLALKRLVQGRLQRRIGQGEGNTAWWLTLPLRWFIMWIPYVYITKVLSKVLGQFLGPGEDTNDVEWKQKKGKEIMKKLKADNPKAIEDPVRQAFDKMKRVKDPAIRLEEFAGLEAVKEEINEIIKFLREPEIFKEMGARPPRGVLIAGRPGTGKTSLAIAIAAEAKVPLVDLNGLELEGGAWVGQGASNVRELFKTARELAPLIILMDDFDYFAGVRGESGDTRKQDHESLINQLLVELDGFETQEGVVLVATSSRPETIDEALRRPGRMDRTITLPMPNKSERETILRKSAKETMDDDLIELVDWNEMARKTAGMTPQQLKEVPAGLESIFVSWKYTDDEELFFVFKWIVKLNKITPDWLANSKWMLRWKSGLRDWLGLKVTKADVEAAVACVDVFNESRPGIEYENPGYIWTREFKFPHAVWAVGRGLLGALLPDFDILENIWLDQGSWEGIGFTRFTKRREGGYEETSTLTRTYYEKKLVHCFGSSVAAKLLLPFGKSNDLSNHELREAEKIATRMVLELGWGPDNGQTIYYSPTGDASLGMGDEVEMELEARVDMIYNAASDRATEMIMKNRHVLDALLEHVLEFDAISKEDIARLMMEHGAIHESEPFVLFPIAEVEEDIGEQTAKLLVAAS
ncbi:hypothetical protein GOP47_0021527 [Adiantum capillus-veneris]|uniref:AAA+ ATPase domain-containing protein n=1 Tax=Adiantum capillus-veneris TaxID=13818 RepID=A0A9D4Z6M4_ADICA|nr:hypothetical protein GOP47_0021527 [Adiantum capillus-veneris]